jgi:hypothetical protein
MGSAWDGWCTLNSSASFTPPKTASGGQAKPASCRTSWSSVISIRPAARAHACAAHPPAVGLRNALRRALWDHPWLPVYPAVPAVPRGKVQSPVALVTTTPGYLFIPAAPEGCVVII